MDKEEKKGKPGWDKKVGAARKKPWGGRFAQGMDETVEAFTASLSFDHRLALEDIEGSRAHCRMLLKQGIIAEEEARLIQRGLEEIEEEIRSDSFPYDLSLEDIHMNIEGRLVEKVGPVGGKLHTGRSRNDQVALDMHLFVKKETLGVMERIKRLQETIFQLALEHLAVVFPGYTHLQRAQPVLLSHHLMAYFWMLQRDRERFAGTYKRADIMPLGAGALSGTSFPVDREDVARELGFARLYENSMDAVSDRDFVLEFLSSAAVLIMHLSRLSEELILWSSQEFSFIELDDAFTTGSSMMPQKKNPDVAELVRAKTGRVYGNLVSLLTVLKGLPLAYNKDMQEDKEPLFDTVDTVANVLNVFTAMMGRVTVNEKRIEQAFESDYSTATELADFLAQKGVPFREAHFVVGGLVRYCLESGKKHLGELSAHEISSFHPELASEEACRLLDYRQAVEAKKCRGGTAEAAVKFQLEKARQLLGETLI